ncbi:hypothetical protein QUB80_03275 [Chlorogloeopsis sp. ULAP01]|nr:hypothetical protein [Chlorogloeopsis sp. ULAP01]MDM9379722.1 hypothetical protein [Chlorogloeopsis sp. ULAP01]
MLGNSDRTQVSPKLASIIDKMVRHNGNQHYQPAEEAKNIISI